MRWWLTPSFIIGAALSALVILMGLIALVWTPHDPTKLAILDRLKGPSAAHWLGTDQLGRDVLSMIMAGSQNSLLVALGAVALSVRPDTGHALPALELTSLEGRPMNLAEFKGKPTVVNLWATWCPPCVREMPVLQQAQAERPGVNFVFLNQGESAEQVSTWLRARRLPMRNVLLDANRQASAAFKQRALPTTLFFDARGQLVSTRVGELSSATLTERLQALAE